MRRLARRAFEAAKGWFGFARPSVPDAITGVLDRWDIPDAGLVCSLILASWYRKGSLTGAVVDLLGDFDQLDELTLDLLEAVSHCSDVVFVGVDDLDSADPVPGCDLDLDDELFDEWMATLQHPSALPPPPPSVGSPRPGSGGSGSSDGGALATVFDLDSWRARRRGGQ